MAKQFGLNQVFGNRPAIDRHKRLAVALGLAVQRARDQFFAGTAFTADQYRGLGRRQFAQQFSQLADRLAVAEQLVFRLIDVNRALSTQTRHAERTPKGHLDPRDIERQCMEIEKPFADEVANVLQPQDLLIQHRDPLGAAAADQFLDGFRALEVKGLQSEQADVAWPIGGIFQGTAVDIPAHRAQSG